MKPATEPTTAAELLADRQLRTEAAIAELTIALAPNATNLRRLWSTSPNLLALMQETVGIDNVPQPGVHTT